MLHVFVDESGNLGYNEGHFIIAMIVLHNPKRIKNIIKSFCSYHSLEEAHASTLNFPQKQFLINKLTKQQDYNITYIIADKMMIKKKKLFDNNNLLFNYLFSFLVKDIIKANTDDVHFHVDNRTQKVASVNSLKEYIQIKAFTEWNFTKELQFEYRDSRECKQLQMADLVANCVWRKYQRKSEDFYSQLNIVKSLQFPQTTFRTELPIISTPKLTKTENNAIITIDINPIGSSKE